jgi:methylphosphotriester-DNA--protein-cysteine methyltransferase
MPVMTEYTMRGTTDIFCSPTCRGKFHQFSMGELAQSIFLAREANYV